jgi:hypothetical protein
VKALDKNSFDVHERLIYIVCTLWGEIASRKSILRIVCVNGFGFDESIISEVVRDKVRFKRCSVNNYFSIGKAFVSMEMVKIVKE